MLSSYCEEENALSQTNKTCSRTCKRFKNYFSYNGVNPQQSISLGEKLLFQRDGDDLHVAAGLLSEEIGHLDSNHKVNKNRKIKTSEAALDFHLSNVSVVQRSVHFIQDEEWSRTEAETRDAVKKNNTHDQPALGSNDHRMINFFIFLNTLDLII